MRVGSLLTGWLAEGGGREFGRPQGKARIATVGVDVGLEGSVPPERVPYALGRFAGGPPGGARGRFEGADGTPSGR